MGKKGGAIPWRRAAPIYLYSPKETHIDYTLQHPNPLQGERELMGASPVWNYFPLFANALNLLPLKSKRFTNVTAPIARVSFNSHLAIFVIRQGI